MFDKYYFLSVSDITRSLGAVTGVPGLPRTWSLTVKRELLSRFTKANERGADLRIRALFLCLMRGLASARRARVAKSGLSRSRQRSVGVEPLAHFLAGLEVGHALGGHLDRIAGARIAPRARASRSRVENVPKPRSSTRPPSASRSAISSKKMSTHLLDFLGAQLGIVLRQRLQQFRSDHRRLISRPPLSPTASCQRMHPVRPAGATCQSGAQRNRPTWQS